MNVSNLMTTDPVTVESGASLAEAMTRMDELRVRHLPVVDAGELVGVLSNRDLLEVPRGEGLVSDVMHADVATVTPDTTAVSLVLEVSLRGIGCLPVLEHGNLVGIVTEVDILRAYVGIASRGELAENVNPPIGELMTRTVRTLAATDTLADALVLLADLDARHAPVVREGELLGILSDRDLRRARGSGLPTETPVRDAMTTDVLTLDPSSALALAAALMVEHRIGALPVVGGDKGELAGILSSSDVVEHCVGTLRSK